MSEYTVSFPGLGIEGLRVKPEAFKLFGISVYWYGLLIATAVILGMFLALRQAKRYGVKEDDILDTLLLAIPMGIIFARLYYVIFSWDQYKDNLLRIFDTRSGGLAFYGSVIGASAGVAIICRVKKIRFSKLVDFMIVYLPLGQAIGRWGNFFNQEAFGTNTKLPWGMFSNGTRDYLMLLNQPGLNPNNPVHPTFLYEFLGNVLIFALLLFIRKQAKRRWECFSWYLVLYGLLRFFVESIRTDALFIRGTQIRVSMLLSALMVLCGLVYLAFVYYSKRPRMAMSWLEEAEGKATDAPDSPDADDTLDAKELNAKETEKAEEADAGESGGEVPASDRPEHLS